MHCVIYDFLSFIINSIIIIGFNILIVIDITFHFQQNLIGITASAFTSDPNNTVVFKQSVAAFMSPLTSDNIAITGVSDTTNARRRRNLRDVSLSHRRLADGIQIDYDVEFNPIAAGFTNATAAFTSFTTSLNTSLSDGSFNVYMQSAATDAGLTSLAAAESTSASFSEPTAVGFDDDGSDGKKNRHIPLIVGLVVGLGGGLLVICLIACCIGHCGKADGDGDQSKPSVGSSKIVFQPEVKEREVSPSSNSDVEAVPASAVIVPGSPIVVPSSAVSVPGSASTASSPSSSATAAAAGSSVAASAPGSASAVSAPGSASTAFPPSSAAASAPGSASAVSAPGSASASAVSGSRAVGVHGVTSENESKV